MSKLTISSSFILSYFPSKARKTLKRPQVRLLSAVMRMVQDGAQDGDVTAINRQALIAEINLPAYMEEKESRVEASWLTKYINELTSMGVIERDVVNRIGQPKKVIYKICNFEPIESLPEKRARGVRNSTETVGRAVQLLDEGVYLDASATTSFGFQDDLCFGIIDMVMRTSSNDPRQVITVDAKLGPGGQNGLIRLTSTTSTDLDVEIMELSDQRLTRCIIRSAREQVRQNVYRFATKQIDPHPELFKNSYSIDLRYAAIDMDMVNKAGQPNIKAASNMLKRLFHTNFNVDASGSTWFQEKFSIDTVSEIFDFRIINSLDAKLALDDRKIKVPRIYQVSLTQRLHDAIIRNVLGGESEAALFNAHPGLVREKIGIFQRFVGFASVRFGRGPKLNDNLENIWYPSGELHGRMAAAHRLDNFKKMWARVVFDRAVEQGTVAKTQKIDGEGSLKEFTAWIWGYQVTLKKEVKEIKIKEKGKIVIVEKTSSGWLTNIKRDVNDSITGTNNKHSKLINKERLEHELRVKSLMEEPQNALEVSDGQTDDNIPFGEYAG